MQVGVPGQVCLIRGPAARGLLALGTAGGAVLLVDPRAGYKVRDQLRLCLFGTPCCTCCANRRTAILMGITLGQSPCSCLQWDAPPHLLCMET